MAFHRSSDCICFKVLLLLTRIWCSALVNPDLICKVNKKESASIKIKIKRKREKRKEKKEKKKKKRKKKEKKKKRRERILQGYSFQHHCSIKKPECDSPLGHWKGFLLKCKVLEAARIYVTIYIHVVLSEWNLLKFHHVKDLLLNW